MTTIDGSMTGGFDSVVTVPGTQAIEGFTITGGFAIEGGGMIVELNATGSIIDCIFDGNEGVFCAGGLQVAGSAAVTDCSFIGNTVEDGDGGGAINVEANGAVTVDGCTFVDNTTGTSGTGDGGAIRVNVNGSAVISGCQITGSSASGSGGAIFVNDDATFELTETSITGCTASSGGAVYIDEDVAERLTSCRFQENSCTFHGGAIRMAGYGTIINCLFNGNSANQGGALFNNDFSDGPYLTSCTLTQNTATSGGAIWSPVVVEVDVTNSILWNNTPDPLEGTFEITFSTVEGGSRAVAISTRIRCSWTPPARTVPPAPRTTTSACRPVPGCGTAAATTCCRRTPRISTVTGTRASRFPSISTARFPSRMAWSTSVRTSR